MSQQLLCEGMEEFQKLIATEEKKDGDIFVLFTGKEDPATGNSWCPDCVKADPVIEKCVQTALKPEDKFIFCVVGDRPTWKDPQCAFRTNAKTKLTGIPTLMKWNTPERLNSNDCAKEACVEMLFKGDD